MEWTGLDSARMIDLFVSGFDVLLVVFEVGGGFLCAFKKR